MKDLFFDVKWVIDESVFPRSFVNGVHLFNRNPNFFAVNPNAPSATYKDIKGDRVRSKLLNHKTQYGVIVFKEVAFLQDKEADYPETAI